MVIGADREFRLALLQSNDTCKDKAVQCSGGRYDPTPSSRRAELPPRYNIQGINRHDGPEDGTLSDRCLTGGLPEFGAFAGGSFRRIGSPRAASRPSTTLVTAKDVCNAPKD
jgi:hypothetical protein